MKNILESLESIQGISDYLKENTQTEVNEGLKDILNTIKSKFKKVFTYHVFYSIINLLINLRGLIWKFLT